MRKPAAVLLVLSLAVLALALVPAAGLAAKGGVQGAGGGGNGGGGKPGGGGGTTSGGTIELVLLNSTDGVAHVGQRVTFRVSTTATNYPWVTVNCYRDTDNALVYKASNGIFPTSLGQDFTLASNTWLSGSAHCTADLENWDAYSKRGAITKLASTSFLVYA